MAEADAVAPIAFDNSGQLEAQLERITAALEEQLASVSTSGNLTAEQLVVLREALESELRNPLPGLIHQNIKVRGLTWEEHEARAGMATQPVDKALLRATIDAAAAASQMDAISCGKRVSKPALLATQVDTRISRVIKSGEDKSEMLDEQRRRRDARRRIIGGGEIWRAQASRPKLTAVFDAILAEVVAKEQAKADLHTSEQLLQRAAEALQRQREKAGRAAEVAAEVARLRARR